MNDERSIYHQAVTLHRQGAYEEAYRLYNQILEKNPSHPGALKGLGFLFYQQKRFPQAEGLLRKSLELDSSDMDSLCMLGRISLETGKSHAADYFQQALSLQPGSSQLKLLLAKALMQDKHYDQAEALLKQILCHEPDHLGALNTLARIMQSHGDNGAAMDLFRKILELRPGLAEAHFNHASMAQLSGDMDVAVSGYKKAIELKPEWTAPYRELSSCLIKGGRIDEAIELLKEAVRLAPSEVENHRSLAFLYQRLNDFEKAIACNKTVLRQKPDHADALHDTGVAYIMRGAFKNAIPFLRKAFSINHQAQTAYCLGDAYLNEKDVHAARFCFQKAVEIDAEYYPAIYQLIGLRARECDWSQREEDRTLLFETLKSHIGSGRSNLNIPLVDLGCFDLPADLNIRVNKLYAEGIRQRIDMLRGRLSFDRQRHAEKERLHIGYISPDFRKHPMGRLIADIFGMHDRRCFRVYGYALTTAHQADPCRRRIREGCDVFEEIAFQSIADAAQRIHSDNIDILIDLAGYTTYTRTEILALQPAPVQALFLGYPNTMGADFVPCMIADEWLVPKELERQYSEKIIRLPHAFIGSLHGRNPEKTGRERHGLSEHAFVFAAFNRPEKIEPLIFSTWMDTLKAVPDSVLWLNGTERVKQNLRNSAQKQGVSPDRLIFSGWAEYDAFLERLSHADLFLDTLYYSAGATAVDAISMGLPVLTCTAGSFASRMGASVCAASGMHELICDNLKTYMEKAVELALNPGLLAEMKDKLITMPEGLPLFDTAAFVKNLEDALWRLWLDGGV
ncbi:tetratricopeptide repeat protein [bacterium]|nr:tetratricopeptide repeat protein [bacterium]